MKELLPSLVAGNRLQFYMPQGGRKTSGTFVGLDQNTGEYIIKDDSGTEIRVWPSKVIKVESFSEISMPKNGVLTQVPVDYLFDMRAKANATGDMSPKREPYTMARIEDAIRKGNIDPISISAKDWEQGVIRDGKHRLIIAKKLGLRTFPVIVRKESVQSLFRAGNETPSEALKKYGKIYGFSHLEFAKGWKKKNGFAHIYQFVASKYHLDGKVYIRDTSSKKELSDNEYIVTEIQGETMIENTRLEKLYERIVIKKEATIDDYDVDKLINDDAQVKAMVAYLVKVGYAKAGEITSAMLSDGDVVADLFDNAIKKGFKPKKTESLCKEADSAWDQMKQQIRVMAAQGIPYEKILHVCQTKYGDLFDDSTEVKQLIRTATNAQKIEKLHEKFCKKEIESLKEGKGKDLWVDGDEVENRRILGASNACPDSECDKYKKLKYSQLPSNIKKAVDDMANDIGAL